MCSKPKIVLIGNKNFVNINFDELKEINIAEESQLSFPLISEFDSSIERLDVDKYIERINRESKIEKTKCKSISGFKNINRKGRM